MSDDPQADLSMIARQQRRILDEMGTMRDDMAVMMATLQRLDQRIRVLEHMRALEQA